MKTKIMLLVGIIATSMWFFSAQIQEKLAGNKPTKSYEEFNREQGRSEYLDDDLAKLTAAAEKEPLNIEKQQALAEGIVAKISQTDSPPQALVFELISTLQKILEIKPDDAQTLLSMGNISYNYQIFDRAAHYFKKYLEIEKEDHGTRATYGSTLSFIGEFDQAEKELLYVIAREPKSFLARANLAINYAISGAKDKAMEAAKEAVEFAPDQESATKFNQFINTIFDESAKPVAPAEDLMAQNQAGDMDRGPISLIEEDIRQNPIAGPKFIRAYAKGRDLELHFINFPMKGMPPFAKEKFIATITSSIEKNQMTDNFDNLRFVDHGTNELMESVKLK